MGPGIALALFRMGFDIAGFSENNVARP
jgi:hypothetical protein